MDKNFSLSAPNFLTLVRLVVSPFVIPALIYFLLPLNIYYVNLAVGGIIGLICLTDLFDGLIARWYKSASAVGKILDPIADKLLVSSALISLVAVGRIFFYIAVILIGRELFVMGLRQVALSEGFFIDPSRLAKYKTFLQMVYVCIAAANPYKLEPWMSHLIWNGSEVFLMLVTCVVSLLSAGYYAGYLRRRFNPNSDGIQ